MPKNEATIGPYTIYRFSKGHYAVLVTESRVELGRVSYRTDPGECSGHWAFREGDDLSKGLDGGAFSLRTCLESILPKAKFDFDRLMDVSERDPSIEDQAVAIVEAMFSLELRNRSLRDQYVR